MDPDTEQDNVNRMSEIDNLIIAAAAASTDASAPNDELGAHELSAENNKSGFWRNVMLDQAQIDSIRAAAHELVEQNGQKFEVEAYSKKQGTPEEYQEMIDLVDFKGGDEDDLERAELMRKHSMIYRPTGPQSRALTLQEQAVNEAALQICNVIPNAIFHKRNLACMAKTVVRQTGMYFPNARSNYFLSGSNLPSQSDSITQPNVAAPASASIFSRSQSYISPKKDSMRSSLSNHECQVIAQTVLQKAAELPQYELKTREQCTLVENFVYTDAQRISKFSVEKMDEMMDYIREVSAIYGRYPSGPPNPLHSLSPHEMGLNEAAAWLVRCVPAFLTHHLQLTEWAKRILYATGLQLPQTPLKQESMYHQNMGDYGSDANAYQMGDMNAPGAVPMANGIIAGYEEEESAIAADNAELIRFLGGSQAIAQLSDVQLEDLGRAQFTVVDPRTDSEMANQSMEMNVEEDDRPLDEAEVLRVTGCETLDEVRSLCVQCSGYTSINAPDLARCVNLRELDLAENAFRVFPRRLHLPRLRRLNLVGNRFFHVPLVEQFPQLTRLSMDERLRAQISPQMLIYFCPRLKYVNGQFVDEMRADYTVRVIQEARSIIEPHIRAKWDTEMAAQLPQVDTRERLLCLIEGVLPSLRERGALLDENLSKYKDLMYFRFVEDFLRCKLAPADERIAFFSPPLNRNLLHLMDDVDVERKQQQQLDADLAAGDDAEDDAEELEMEARAAGERALFDAADELMGLNLPDFTTWQVMQSQTGPQGQQLQAALVMDSTGRVQQQLVSMGANGASAAAYPFHLGRSLRQGRSIVMTVVRPKGVSGRPVAEFLPGELRNKDYVKGYMASEIYKKAVKDTLGQKGTPKKRHSLGRPKKSDAAAAAAAAAAHQAGTPSSAGKNAVSASPLGEISNSLASSKKQAAVASAGVHEGGGGGGKQHLTSDSGVLPPRPKKRKSMGAHRSLRDLCSEVGPAAAAAAAALPDPYASSKSDSTLIDYDPLHFIRCHAKDNDAGDSETKVWRCLFEPNPMRPEETTHVVATCGGECVCLINCETGKVLKRFKHVEEEFYTIAWTTVEVANGKRANILAAAGKMHEIRLLHPEQLVCYAEMKGHTEDITAMIFHQTQPTILFSGDSKASVIVWDIGIPTVPNYKTRYQLLMRLRCPRLDVNPVLNLVFLPHYAYLVAGCEDGLFAWKVTDLRLEKREREPDMELKLDMNHEVCIDGLAQLSDNALVIKVVESGEILIFDFASVLERRKGLQRVVPLEMRGHLLWQKTDEIYINVSVRQNLGAVVCGDNEGSIWIYDLDPFLDDLHASSRKQFHVKPIKILEWPECSVQGNRDEDQQLKESISSGFRNPVVNAVEMSSDGHYLAAVTDNNLVCIWRYAPPANPASAVLSASAGGHENGSADHELNADLDVRAGNGEQSSVFVNMS